MTSDDISIKSNNFNVDEIGNLTCNDATIHDAKFNGGKIELISDGRTPSFTITSEKNESDFSELSSSGFNIFKNNQSRGYIGTYYSSDGNEGCWVSLSSFDGQKNSHLSDRELFVQTGWIDEVKYYTLTQRSQEELKKEIKKIEINALEILKKSDIYEFRFKNDSNIHKKRYGFIIGDNYKTPNEIISQDNDGIDLYNTISIAWKAIQEQQEIINKMQEKIKELEEKIDG